MSKNAKRPGFHFHPLEISCVGYSNSGKTTLLVRVIEKLKDRWKLGYVKHDAHSFQMDREGKDTFRAREAGAESIYISNANHSALLGGDTSLFLQKSMFLDLDAVIVEGYKSLSMMKLVVLDETSSILDELESFESVLAFIGPQADRPTNIPSEKPYYCRDAITEIAALIEEFWQTKLDARPLRALILAGGRSERMGRDKYLLEYKGKPQVVRLFEELHELGLDPMISLRDDQTLPAEVSASSLLKDRFQGLGPMSGILTAFQEHPETAWLVVACDLPLLDVQTLNHLLSERDPRKAATAYRSSSDRLPEPLCAIYEPKIKTRLFEALSLGYQCPRKVLLNTKSKIIDPIHADALANANTPDEYRRLASIVQETAL